MIFGIVAGVLIALLIYALVIAHSEIHDLKAILRSEHQAWDRDIRQLAVRYNDVMDKLREAAPEEWAKESAVALSTAPIIFGASTGPIVPSAHWQHLAEVLAGVDTGRED